jgi:hypothetical protein
VVRIEVRQRVVRSLIYLQMRSQMRSQMHLQMLLQMLLQMHFQTRLVCRFHHYLCVVRAQGAPVRLVERM